MRKLFTCLIVILSFIAYLPPAFTVYSAAPAQGSAFDYGMLPSDYPPSFADPTRYLDILTRHANRGQVAKAGTIPSRLHFWPPIA